MLVALAAAALISPANLSKLVLKPASVGAGYVLVHRTDGQGTAQRTLDLCGTSNYGSEQLRSGRLQVDYLKPNAKLALSNEVVLYKAGGAAEAMREVAQHADNCPAKPIAFEGQPPLRYTITHLVDSKLIKGYLALRVVVTGTIKGQSVRAVRYAVYQRFGNILSGVYSYAAAGVAESQQQSFVLHAAEASAKALRGGSRQGLPA
jgi:hypothetical protein